MPDRRLLLTRATKLLALFGLCVALYPFLATLLPDAHVDDRRRAQWEREIDLSNLQPGEFIIIDDWPGGPLVIFRRSTHELAGLARIETQLHDPQSQHSRQPEALRTPTRSQLPEYFVFIPVDTDRACQVRYIPPNKQPKPAIVWYGGFSEPCNGSLYDTAGRVYREYRSERQQNLTVPGYTVIGNHRIRLTSGAS
jgi:ubiquinol-cytochrome c reductase iron-sulfur subunit